MNRLQESFDFRVFKAEFFIVFQVGVDGLWCADNLPEEHPLLGKGIVEKLIALMQMQSRSCGVGNFGASADVIEVSMGMNEFFDFNIEVADFFQNEFVVISRVDDDRLSGFFRVEDRAITLVAADRKTDKYE